MTLEDHAAAVRETPRPATAYELAEDFLALEGADDIGTSAHRRREIKLIARLRAIPGDAAERMAELCRERDAARAKIRSAHDALDRAGAVIADGTHPQLVGRIEILAAHVADLVAACKFLFEQCRDEGMDGLGGPDEEEYKAAEAAIAKAEGTHER